MNGGTYQRLVVACNKFSRAAQKRLTANFYARKNPAAITDAFRASLADAKVEERKRLDELLAAAEGVRAALSKRGAA